ncbi:hypothetical protein PybrP1_006785 [[Pythium] brassicae (nom. inval.)]|nr:hypothetical protein PybrP1_006785 [[Pythium] brassicae (nom. inval.)]
MGDFGDIDDFNEHAVQGKPIRAYKNGHFENPKVLFVQHHWTWDEFLCAASQRLEMVPMASRVFNADGAEIDDIMVIEENDMLFFSAGRSFKAPSSGKEDAQSAGGTDEKFATVVGGYKVTTLLGRGGFGEVRLGVHQLTNDKVALKFILKSEMGSLGDVERTTTEIQCLTALNHPSIIKLLRVINEPNHVVLVFELLEGGDLFHYLKNLPAGGLAEENDIATVKIADFGLSDFYKPGAMMKTSCGSISYLAPEVFRGTSNAGPPLDVWSLGVILFAIVCGRLPFEGSDLVGTNRPRENVIRNRIMRCQYKLDDHLSPALADLVAQMLKLDPNERATIPEIFGHPWVRGMASGCPPMDIVMVPARDRCDDGDDDLDFGITYSPTKVALPGSPAFLSPVATAATTDSNADDKLPSIVSRSPSRIDSSAFGAVVMPSTAVGAGLSASGGGGGGTSLVPTGTPGTGRARAGRLLDNPLQPKLSTAKLDPKHSPRPVIGALAPTAKSSGGSLSTATSPLGSSSSSMAPGNFKRNASSTGSSSRGRPRQGTANGASGDKAHAERAAAHAGDSEKLPVAHQKSTRRRSDHGDGDAPPQQAESARGATGSSHGLDAIGGRKLHHPQQHGELASAHD